MNTNLSSIPLMEELYYQFLSCPSKCMCLTGWIVIGLEKSTLGEGTNVEVRCVSVQRKWSMVCCPWNLRFIAKPLPPPHLASGEKGPHDFSPFYISWGCHKDEESIFFFWREENLNSCHLFIHLTHSAVSFLGYKDLLSSYYVPSELGLQQWARPSQSLFLGVSNWVKMMGLEPELKAWWLAWRRGAEGKGSTQQETLVSEAGAGWKVLPGKHRVVPGFPAGEWRVQILQDRKTQQHRGLGTKDGWWD